MKLIWKHLANSFKEAGLFDRAYYSSMNASDRLATMQLLRDFYFKLHPGLKNGCRKGLRRSFKVVA